MMLDISGIEDFAAVPSLEPYAFARVLVLAPTGAYEWQRGGGWRRLAGEPTGGQGLSFDELQATLRDPDWLADPDGKAAQIVAEIHSSTAED